MENVESMLMNGEKLLHVCFRLKIAIFLLISWLLKPQGVLLIENADRLKTTALSLLTFIVKE